MLANLRALFGVVVDIVLLRRGPEQLPASQALLGIVVVTQVLITAVMTAMSPKPPPSWPLQLLFSTVFPMLWFQAALTLAQKRERLVQTLTAFFAASALFMPVLVPLAAALQPYMADPDNVKPPPGGVVLPAAVFTLWLLAVQVRIVRSAFEWPIFLSIVFVLAQQFVGTWLLALLFATPRPAG
jgi:hypothetical protein